MRTSLTIITFVQQPDVRCLLLFIQFILPDTVSCTKLRCVLCPCIGETRSVGPTEDYTEFLLNTQRHPQQFSCVKYLCLTVEFNDTPSLNDSPNACSDCGSVKCSSLALPVRRCNNVCSLPNTPPAHNSMPCCPVT